MRAVSVHRDALVVTSRMWQTTATVAARRRGGGADRLALLPGRARGAAGAARPGRASSPTGCSPPTPTSTTCSGGSPSPACRWGWASRPRCACAPSPARPSASLRDNDDEHYVARPAPLSPGRRSRRSRCPAGSTWATRELELHPAEGHTADGCAAVRPRARASWWPGDYLSDVEIPMISPGGSLDAYRATLARLAPLVEEARDDRARPRLAARRATTRCASSTRTWTTWTRWSAARSARRCPPAGRARAQRQIHAENLSR